MLEKEILQWEFKQDRISWVFKYKVYSYKNDNITLLGYTIRFLLYTKGGESNTFFIGYFLYIMQRPRPTQIAR